MLFRSFLSFSVFSNLFWLEMKPLWYVLIFWIILLFSSTRQVGTKRIDNFYLLTFPAFSNLFWLIMKRHWYFLIFLLFSWNFLLHIGQERNRTKIFIFSLSQPLPTFFGLKWGSNGILLTFWIFLLFFFWNFLLHIRLERNGTER